MASVTANHSVVCDDERGTRCRVESGCRVLFGRITRASLATTWDRLRHDHALHCAHLHAPPVFSGCVWDFLRPTRCPGAGGGGEQDGVADADGSASA